MAKSSTSKSSAATRVRRPTRESSETPPEVPISTADLIRTTPLAKDSRPLDLKAATPAATPSAAPAENGPPRGFGPQHAPASVQPPASSYAERSYSAPATSFVLQSRAPSRINVREAVRVITVKSGPEKGLVRTDGLSRYGHSELIIAQGAPLFVLPRLVQIVYDVVELMLNTNQRVYSGARIVADEARFTLRSVEYMGKWHLQLSDDELRDDRSYGYGGYDEGYRGSYGLGASCGPGGCGRPVNEKFDL